MKKIKWNWGTGIALAYTVFVGVLVFAVVKSTTFDHSLVVEDYYAKDIAYQEHYDKLANSLALEKDLEVRLERPNLILDFPGNLGEIRGEILFFSPSHSHLDFRVPIQTDEQFRQTIPVGEIRPGLWWVKIEWQARGTEYYQEKRIYF